MSRKSWAADAVEAALMDYNATGVNMRALLWWTVEKTIEECARQVRDTDVVEAPGINGTYYAQLGDAAVTREACAKAVEALLEPGDEGEGG